MPAKLLVMGVDTTWITAGLPEAKRVRPPGRYPRPDRHIRHARQSSRRSCRAGPTLPQLGSGGGRVVAEIGLVRRRLDAPGMIDRDDADDRQVLAHRRFDFGDVEQERPNRPSAAQRAASCRRRAARPPPLGRPLPIAPQFESTSRPAESIAAARRTTCSSAAVAHQDGILGQDLGGLHRTARPG